MKTGIYCLSCGSEMRLTRTIKTAKAYKGRKYVCECGYEETVFGTNGPDSALLAEKEPELKPTTQVDYQEDIEI